MNLTEIAKAVAAQVGSSQEEAWGFLDEAVKMIAKKLDEGEDINLKGVGTLVWVPVPSRKLYSFHKQRNRQVEAGFKLRFRPHGRFQTRRRKPNDSVKPRRRNDKTGGRSR
jgi:nucleoid DNA-binding protein